MNDGLGKDAETKIQEWLDRPEDGYSFDRIKDQMTGFYGSKNICDFTLFKTPYMYYIESKATWEDRFDFAMLTGFDAPDDITRQYGGLLHKSKISHVFGLVIVLFASYRRAFVIDIREIKRLADLGKKSINIKKVLQWDFEYKEVVTVPNNRKKLLDYNRENVI